MARFIVLVLAVMLLASSGMVADARRIKKPKSLKPGQKPVVKNISWNK